mmetsp:Transcript_14191/g.30802  ORF Transcript_14191/g.30802 Transcript_14191/m.30802 type:complete len:80 (-) Transcript_14191:785-1024(-)
MFLTTFKILRILLLWEDSCAAIRIESAACSASSQNMEVRLMTEFFNPSPSLEFSREMTADATLNRPDRVVLTASSSSVT